MEVAKLTIQNMSGSKNVVHTENDLLRYSSLNMQNLVQVEKESLLSILGIKQNVDDRYHKDITIKRREEMNMLTIKEWNKNKTCWIQS